MASKRDIYQEVTDQIVESLEAGTAPWVRPWKDDTTTPSYGNPRNFATKRPYSGINVILLWLAAARNGYSSDEWMTFNQAKKLGAHVRKGERSTMITFWKLLKKREEDEETGEIRTRTIPLLRHFNVFNVEQIEGLDLPEPEEQDEDPEEPVEMDGVFAEVEDFLSRVGARVGLGGNRAYYSPAEDRIQLPKPEQFDHLSAFFSTSIHEHVHWTGHESRLDRLEKGATFGSESYGKEELVAELGAAFKCAEFGLPGKLQHPEYIASWIRTLKADKRAIFSATSAAKKAVAYLEGTAEAEEVKDAA